MHVELKIMLSDHWTQFHKKRRRNSPPDITSTSKKPRTGLSAKATTVTTAVRNFLRDHEWTLDLPTRVKPEVHAAGLELPKTRGAPEAYIWTPTRTIALIRLVVKTDLPFDYVPVALKEDDFEPGSDACRRKWRKIFEGTPEQARPLCSEEREQRYQDLKLAYKQKCKHELLLSRASLSTDVADPSGAGGICNVEQIGKYATFCEPTPPKSPGSAAQQSPHDLLFRKEGPLIAGPSPAPTTSPGSAVPEETGQNQHVDSTRQQKFNRPNKGWTPSTRADCARLINMDEDELEWIMYGKESKMQRVRQSFVSRYSKRFSGSCETKVGSSKAEISPPQVPTIDPIGPKNSPELCQFLRREFCAGTTPWRVLGIQVVNKAAEGADVNAADSDGITPLFLAVAWGCLPVVHALLIWGADPEAKSKLGQSISAYSRPFARDSRISEQHIAHVDIARDVVKYNAKLRDVERRVRARRASLRSLQPVAETTLEPIPSSSSLTRKGSFAKLDSDRAFIDTPEQLVGVISPQLSAEPESYFRPIAPQSMPPPLPSIPTSIYQQSWPNTMADFQPQNTCNHLYGPPPSSSQASKPLASNFPPHQSTNVSAPNWHSSVGPENASQQLLQQETTLYSTLLDYSNPSYSYQSNAPIPNISQLPGDESHDMRKNPRYGQILNTAPLLQQQQQQPQYYPNATPPESLLQQHVQPSTSIPQPLTNISHDSIPFDGQHNFSVDEGNLRQQHSIFQSNLSTSAQASPSQHVLGNIPEHGYIPQLPAHNFYQPLSTPGQQQMLSQPPALRNSFSMPTLTNNNNNNLYQYSQQGQVHPVPEMANPAFNMLFESNSYPQTSAQQQAYNYDTTSQPRENEPARPSFDFSDFAYYAPGTGF